MCQRLFFNKVGDFRLATLLKRDSDTDVFLRILRNFKEPFRWLLLTNTFF